MKNLQEGGETVMEIGQVKFDVQLDDDIFKTKNLKRR